MKRILSLVLYLFLAPTIFADANTPDANAQLIRAAKDGNLPPVQKLLADGADVNARGENGTTALMIAAYHGHTEVVKLLLEKGADVNARTIEGGVTPLWQASYNGHAEVVKLLLEKGADVNAKTTDDSVTPLYIATLENHTEVIKLLLAAKADVNIKTILGDTPLGTAKLMAKMTGNTQIVDMLEKAGAKISEQIPVEKTNAFPLFGENKEKDASISNVVAITVNGAKIYGNQIAALAKQRAEETSRSNPDYVQARKVIIEELIFAEIVLQKGKEKHISVSDEEVKDIVSRAKGVSYDEFIKHSANYTGDLPSYLKTVKANIMYRKLLLKEYADKLNPTEEQMKAYYAENKDYYRTKEEFYLKYIDINPDKDSNDPNQAKAQAKAKAEQILQKIRNGEDFDRFAETESNNKRLMARERIEAELKQKIKESPKDVIYGAMLKELQSENFFDPSAEKRTRTELGLYYSPEFENATVALKPEQISNVVEDKRGFYIIKLIKHVEANIPSFEEVKEQVRQHARNKPTEQAYYEYGQKLLKEADIKYANKEDDLGIPEKQIKGQNK